MGTLRSVLNAPRTIYKYPAKAGAAALGKINDHSVKTGAVVIGADLGTKILERNCHSPASKQCITENLWSVTDNICLELHFNKGGVNGRPFDTTTKIAFAVAMTSLAYLFIKAKSKISKLAISLLLSGSIGNLIDRLIFNKVTDFIKLGSWDNFNLADAALGAGNLLLLYEILSKPTGSGEHLGRIGFLKGSFTKNIFNTFLQTLLYTAAIWCFTGYISPIPALILSLIRDIRHRGERMF